MSLQTITDLNVDFYDKRYITINAKQLDRDSRFLSVTCYNRGEPYHLNNGEHVAYIRYRKADDYGVFNKCDINNKGKIIVNLTEQMLASDGVCYADLVIVNKGDADIDPYTGKISEHIENASVLSTMTFCIDVSEVPVANSDIESTYEFILLNENLEKYWANFEDVVLTARSWAEGGTGIDDRPDENINNSKYWANKASGSASMANTSALNAAHSEELAEGHMHDALSYKNDANTYMTNAKTYMDNARTYMDNAKTSEINAKTSETNAATSETNAKTYMDEAFVSEQNAQTSEINAKTSETNAATSETNAKKSETNTLNSVNKAQSYAVGGTGTRDNEDYDNAHYYYELTKNIVIGLDSGFIPMGTVTFAELASVEKATGYVYNISDDFVTTSDFREGEGKSYTAGTNVYFCADGMWDCFGGASSPTATVDEVKTYLGI